MDAVPPLPPSDASPAPAFSLDGGFLSAKQLAPLSSSLSPTRSNPLDPFPPPHAGSRGLSLDQLPVVRDGGDTKEGSHEKAGEGGKPAVQMPGEEQGSREEGQAGTQGGGGGPTGSPQSVSPVQLPPIPLMAPTPTAAGTLVSPTKAEAVPEPPPRPSFQGAKPVLGSSKRDKASEEGSKEKWSDVGWDMDPDMAETLRRTFWQMDENKSGWLDEIERRIKKPELTAVMLEFGVPVDAFDGMGHISFNEFRKPFAREWEVATKLQALPGQAILRSMAEVMEGGSSTAPLGHLESLSESGIAAYCASVLAPALARVLVAEVSELKAKRKAEEEEEEANEGLQPKGTSSKFATSVFGQLAEFREGLAGKIGLPNPNLMEGIKNEHCRMEDSNVGFSPENSTVETTPAGEFAAVTDPEVGRRVSEAGDGRIIRPVSELMGDRRAADAGLLEEEVLALLLYTGPMHRWYNAVLRHFPEEDVALVKGNRYATTINCIVSGIIKLSRHAVLPKDRVVFRALGGREVPVAFRQEDAFGVRGGLDLGLMSATLHRTVAARLAVQSAAKGAIPLMFEVTMSGVNRGAELGWLSQFAGEAEVVFPPQSFVEAVGNVRLETMAGGRQVKVMGLTVNANVTGSTIEETLGKRKNLHMSQMENALLEVKRWAGGLGKTGKEEIGGEDQFVFDFGGSVIKQAEEMVERHRNLSIEWFHDDKQSEVTAKELVLLSNTTLEVCECQVKGSQQDKDLVVVQLAVRLVGGEPESCASRVKRIRRVAGSEELGVGERAAQARDIAMKLLQQKGPMTVASLNEADEEGDIPLMSAVRQGDVESARLLMAAGSRVDGIEDKEGLTPLQVAWIANFTDCLECLVEVRGKQVLLSEDADGKTLLELSAVKGRSDTVKALGRTLWLERMGFEEAEKLRVLRRLVLGGLEGAAAVVIRLGGEEGDAMHKLMGDVPLNLHRGDMKNVAVVASTRVLEVYEYSTLRSCWCCPVGEKAYYEIEILTLGRSSLMGYASDTFQRSRKHAGDGVGELPYSWAADGVHSEVWIGGKRTPCGVKFAEGDVVGVACDLAGGKMHVSVNGDFSKGAAVDVAIPDCGGGLYAALSLWDSKVRYNFGEADFKHACPKDGGYVALMHARAGKSKSLHSACLLGRRGSVVRLLEEGGLLDDVAGDGKTCVMRAAGAGHTATVAACAKIGGKGMLFSIDKDGETCWGLAHAGGRSETVRVIEGVCGKVTCEALQRYAKSRVWALNDDEGHHRKLKKLWGVMEGDVTAVRVCGKPCIEVAATLGHTETIRGAVEALGWGMMGSSQDEVLQVFKHLLFLEHDEASRVVAHFGSKKGMEMFESAVDTLPLTLHRGVARNVRVSLGRERVVEASSLVTVRSCRSCSAPNGLAYYEVQIVEMGDIVSIGYATNIFGKKGTSDHNWVGGERYSWAADGARKQCWHGGTSKDVNNLGKVLEAWSPGDVIGVAVDIENGKMSVSVNGDWSSPWAELDIGTPPDRTALYAAVSLGAGSSILYNFGEHQFRHKPPPGGVAYMPLSMASGGGSVTSLHTACVLGRRKSFLRLVRLGLDVYAVGGDGKTCSMRAAQGGHANLLQACVDVGGATVLNEVDKKGRTCTLLACAGGHVQAIQTCVDLGGREVLMDADNEGMSCIEIAAEKGHSAAWRWIAEAMWSYGMGFQEEQRLMVMHHCLFREKHRLARDFAQIGPNGNLMLKRAEQEVCLTLHRGEFKNVAAQSLPSRRSVHFRAPEMTTLRTRWVCPVGSKAYYEVKIVEMAGYIHVGWASRLYDQERLTSQKWAPVGREPLSWGVADDGSPVKSVQLSGNFDPTSGTTSGEFAQRWAGKVLNGGAEGVYECSWKPGDVIGVAVDLGEGAAIHVSVNGDFSQPKGVLIPIDVARDCEGGAFAALSGTSARIVCNFGESKFRYKGPSDGEYAGLAGMDPPPASSPLASLSRTRRAAGPPKQ